MQRRCPEQRRDAQHGFKILTFRSFRCQGAIFIEEGQGLLQRCSKNHYQIVNYSFSHRPDLNYRLIPELLLLTIRASGKCKTQWSDHYWILKKMAQTENLTISLKWLLMIRNAYLNWPHIGSGQTQRWSDWPWSADANKLEVTHVPACEQTVVRARFVFRDIMYGVNYTWIMEVNCFRAKPGDFTFAMQPRWTNSIKKIYTWR